MVKLLTMPDTFVFWYCTTKAFILQHFSVIKLERNRIHTYNPLLPHNSCTQKGCPLYSKQPYVLLKELRFHISLFAFVLNFCPSICTFHNNFQFFTLVTYSKLIRRCTCLFTDIHRICNCCGSF